MNIVHNTKVNKNMKLKTIVLLIKYTYFFNPAFLNNASVLGACPLNAL